MDKTVELFKKDYNPKKLFFGTLHHSWLLAGQIQKMQEYLPKEEDGGSDKNLSDKKENIPDGHTLNTNDRVNGKNSKYRYRFGHNEGVNAVD